MTKYMFTIPYQLHGLNEYLRACNKHYQAGGKLKKADMEIVMLYARQQLKRLSLDKKVDIIFKFYRTNAMTDKDNISSYGHKVILDALQEVHILRNDGWKEVGHMFDFFYIDQKNPRTEVTIIEVNEDKHQLQNIIDYLQHEKQLDTKK